MMIAKRNLLGMTREELSAVAAEAGEPSYRGGQLYAWLYTKSAPGFENMTDLSARFRERLARVAEIRGVQPVLQRFSKRDGTTKFLFELRDGLAVESVLIPPNSSSVGEEVDGEDEAKRRTLCVSTQVGCPLDCAFCATATMGFRRNLTSGEIVDQLLQVRRASGKRITNVVFMGMGEPLLNYEPVMTAADIITSGIHIAAKRITISTAGHADRIRRMGEERRRFKLAVSLHSAVDETRTRLMPINRTFGLDLLMGALEYYYLRTKQRITFEVIFFDGVNDGPRDIDRLIGFARRVPSKINVIPYHSISFAGPRGFGASLRPSPRVEASVEKLRLANLTVMVRSSAGEDIDAACGQLAVGESAGGRRDRAPRTAAN